MEFPQDSAASGGLDRQVPLNVQESGGDSSNYDDVGEVNLNILAVDEEYANHILETQSENNALANEQ